MLPCLLLTLVFAHTEFIPRKTFAPLTFGDRVLIVLGAPLKLDGTPAAGLLSRLKKVCFCFHVFVFVVVVCLLIVCAVCGVVLSQLQKAVCADSLRSARLLGCNWFSLILGHICCSLFAFVAVFSHSCC